MKDFIGGNLERILESMGYATKREQALALELAQAKEELSAAMARGDAATARGDAATAVADERLALLTASAARAESAEKQLGVERTEHELAAKRTVRAELKVQALKRRRERLQAELCKVQDQLAHADVSGAIRELQEQNAQLQRRLADLQTYFTLRSEPFTAANLAGDKQS